MNIRVKYWLNIVFCSLIGATLLFSSLSLSIAVAFGYSPILPTLLLLIGVSIPPSVAAIFARKITKNDTDEKMAWIITFILQIPFAVLIGFVLTPR